MYAGTPANYKRLLATIKTKLGGGKSPDEVVIAIEDAYRAELLKIHEAEVLTAYGLSRDDFFAFGKERLTEYKFYSLLVLIRAAMVTFTRRPVGVS